MVGLGEQADFKNFDQRRQVLDDSFPNNFGIDVKVSVSQAVAHTDDLGPRKLGDLCLPLFSHFGGSFADDFDRFDDGQKQHCIGVEIISAATLHKVLSLFGSIQHMFEPRIVI